MTGHDCQSYSQDKAREEIDGTVELLRFEEDNGLPVEVILKDTPMGNEEEEKEEEEEEEEEEERDQGKGDRKQLLD